MFGMGRAQTRDEYKALRSALDESWAVVEFTPDGTVLDGNDAFFKTVGYPREELVGKHHALLCPPEVAKSDFYRDFWRGLAEGKPSGGRYKRMGKGGRIMYLRASYMPIKGPDGKVERVIKLAVDVSSDADEEFDARGKLEAINRVQAVIEFDVEGNILHANPNFLGAVGYTLEEVKGRHHRIFMPSADAESAEYREMWRKLAAGEPVAGEFKRLGKGGKEVWIAASYNPVKDRYGKVLRVVKFANDITPRMRSVDALAKGLQRLAAGDLSAGMETPLEAAYEPLRLDVNKVVESYRDLIEKVNGAMAVLRSGSSRIADGAAGLSERAERQAATLEEIAATIVELSGGIKSTADRSADGGKTARAAAVRAREGQEVIRSATEAVRTIEESSRKINEINSVIEGIAFQTNLLALNAAVEAARAGEAGKGFAVVAAEVRNLAQRSSDAAADTTRLIKESSEHVERGAQMMTSSVEVFEDIRRQVESVADGIADIERANSEQSNGVTEINQAVSDLDDATQGNAGVATENAAAARGLDEELAELADMLTFFRTGGEEGAGHGHARDRAA